MYRQLYLPYFPDLGEVGSNGSMVPVKCLFHDDRHASAAISPSTGVYYCHTCGMNLSPAGFIEKISQCTKSEAWATIDSYRQEHQLVEYVDTFTSTLIYNPKFGDLAARSKELMASDLPIVIDYCESRALRFETLVDVGVGFLPAEYTHWERDSLVFPYTVDGKVIGIRYRDIHGSKGGEPGCHFSLWGVDSLDSEPETVVLVEGETDRLRSHQALGGKIPVISAPGNKFRREWVREFAGVGQVILVPQSDEAANNLIQACQSYLRDRVTVVPLPWRRKQIGNDVADWLRYHDDEDFVSLVQGVVTLQHRKIMSGSDMVEVANQPRQWLIENLLVRRQVAIIIGQPKSKKTWLALNLVKCILTPGSDLCGIPGLTSTNGAPRKVLIIEEEGDIEELRERAEKVLTGTPWKTATFWAHHLGCRLDEIDWVDKLIETIKAKEIDLLIIDPFSRTYTVDENNASEMGTVWHQIAKLLVRFEHLSIIILHHMNKGGCVASRWSSLRGSSRTAAEVDLGIFVDNRPKSERDGIVLAVEGRSIPKLVTPEGKDEFRLRFDNGLLELDTTSLTLNKWRALYAEICDREEWYLEDAADHYGVSTRSIITWMEKAMNIKGELLMETTGKGRGVKSKIVLTSAGKLQHLEDTNAEK